MILVCPFCKTKYLIPANVFALGPRRVRCARCSHSWEADLPKEVNAVIPPPELEITPPPTSTIPVPPGSNLPAIRKEPLPIWVHSVIGAGIVIFVLILVLILNRQDIAGRWPKMESLYVGLGLHIRHTGEGISIDDVRSELQYESGVVRLFVEGKIHNTTERNQLVPNILASAMGPDGHIIQSWQIDAPAAKLSPGEIVPFRTSIKAPEEMVADVNLEFVELKNAP